MKPEIKPEDIENFFNNEYGNPVTVSMNDWCLRGGNVNFITNEGDICSGVFLYELQTSSNWSFINTSDGQEDYIVFLKDCMRLTQSEWDAIYE